MQTLEQIVAEVIRQSAKLGIAYAYEDVVDREETIDKLADLRHDVVAQINEYITNTKGED